MTRFTKLPTLIRSAAIALVLGGATLGAATLPVQAAPAIDFHFGFGGGGISIGGGRYCLSDRQVRVLLRGQGFDQIRFFDRRGRVVGAQAERYNRDFRVWVDTCRARIVSVERIRRHDGGYGGVGGYGGYGGYKGY